MPIAIVNGRIETTRITVYDVYYYLQTPEPWTPDEIADLLRLTPEELQSALDYIEAHRDQVHAVHLQIEERNRRGNPPELQAKLDANHEKFMAMMRERWRQMGLPERNHAGDSGGPER